ARGAIATMLELPSRQIELAFEQVPVPDPSVNVLQDNTSCVDPSGSARASVQGNTDDYFFEWFSREDPNTLIGTGAVITGLGEVDQGSDTIFYEVQATEIATGCISARGTVGIILTFEELIFEVSTSDNTCIREADQFGNQFSGRATIQFPAGGGKVDRAIWLENGVDTVYRDNSRVPLTDLSWTFAPPGDHRVVLLTEDRCESYEATFSIGTEIIVYNGVSDNSDDLNDFFLIDCIEFFPSNLVEIFDRGGQRVYREEGYNNADKRFNGVANTGATLGSGRLPEGTYYYIITKGDGTQPIQGFLELVR
ncbi:MAG: gliding motility-associated C-terminal domain-containing protein, partial [Bacteroidota bacterium]